MTTKSNTCLFLLFAVCSSALGTPLGLTPSPTFRRCILPVNVESGIHYRGGGAEDSLEWGPSTLTLTPDGRLVVADSVLLRLIEYGEDCSFQRVLDLAGKVKGISDVKVTRDGYFVLDAVSSNATILQLDSDTKILRRFRVADSLVAELPSLIVEDGQRVLLSLQEGAKTLPLVEDVDSTFQDTPFAGLHDQGARFLATLEQKDASEGTNGPHRLSLMIDSQEVIIDSAEPVAMFNVLGVADNRHVYARAVEVTSISGRLRVRESIYRVTFDGRVDGVARGLFADQHVFVPNRLAVDRIQDRVLALYTYPDSVEVHELVFSNPDELLPLRLVESSMTDEGGDRIVDELFLSAAADERCKVFPEQIRKIANGYINNSTRLSDANIVDDGTCERRKKPQYLKGQGVYRSVPYDWGGFDSVAMYNDLMSKGKKAGDTSSDAVANCSRGVDCSGFVSRTWQLPGKEGSATLGRISTVLSDRNELRFGDVLNKDSTHVVLIDSVQGSTVNIYEATTDQGIDQVVRRPTSWSRYDKYKMLRYNNYCEKAAGQIGCVNRSPQLRVDVPINLTGGPFSGQGSGVDYNGTPLYFKVSGNFNRRTRALEVALEFYVDTAFRTHVRTDRCVGSLDERDRFTDPQCDLIRNTSGDCKIFLQMNLRRDAAASTQSETSSSSGSLTVRR